MAGTEVDATLPARSADAGSARTFAVGEQAGGRYRIVRFIAAGAIGEVYAAEDLVVGGTVALKALRSEHEGSATAVERLRREIALARKVTDPHICRLHDVGEHDGRVFLTMELLDGVTLAERLKATGALPIADVERLAVQLVTGLGMLHRAGIVHRDFKTGNVVVVGDGEAARAVITDFGLARSLRPDRDASLTVESSLLGTPAYMAPEQVEGRHATPASDIYALGVVLFELVTGALPFREDTAMATATARLRKDPPRPSAIRPDVPARWDAIIGRCLARDADARPATVDDVLVVPEPRRSRRWFLAAGGAAVAGASLGAWRVLGGGEDAGGAAATRTEGLIAVLPVAGDGSIHEDPLRIAITIDLHAVLATVGLPMLALNGGSPRTRLAATAMILAGEPDPVAAARAIAGVTATASMAIAPRAKGEPVAIDLAITSPSGTSTRRFTRPETELPKLVDELAAAIASSLGWPVPRRPLDSVALAPGTYERYGLGIVRLYTDADWPRGPLERLVADAPRFARAAAMLGNRFLNAGAFTETDESSSLERAIELADQALAIDPDLALARFVRGHAKLLLWDWAAAEAETRRAFELAPTDERIARGRSFGLVMQARFDEAIALTEARCARDPRGTDVASDLAWHYYYARRYKEAVRELEPVVGTGDTTGNEDAASTLALSLAEIARFDDALAVATRLRAQLGDPDSGDPDAAERWNAGIYWVAVTLPVYVMAGKRADAVALRDQIIRRGKLDPAADVGHFPTALMADALGETEHAMAELELTVAAHGLEALFLKIERLSPLIRADPRFQALLKKVGFPA